LQIMPGGDSRYIIMIVPFTLLTITTYFNDSKKLRLFLGIILVLTISVSMFRLVWWDSIYFNNNKSYIALKNKISEPYMLISESEKIAYYIFGKSSNTVEDINNQTKNIILFGNDKYNNKSIKNIGNKYKIDHIENYVDKIIVGRDQDSIYDTIKITIK
jgi:hypothetical protein